MTLLHRTPSQSPSGQGFPTIQFCLLSQDGPPVDSYNALSAIKDDGIGVGIEEGLGELDGSGLGLALGIGVGLEVGPDKKTFYSVLKA